MQTLTIAITNDAAIKKLHELEKKHFIHIVAEDDIDAPSLPGTPLTIAQFRSWVADAEQTPTISYDQARSLWATKKKQLQKISK